MVTEQWMKDLEKRTNCDMTSDEWMECTNTACLVSEIPEPSGLLFFSSKEKKELDKLLPKTFEYLRSLKK